MITIIITNLGKVSYLLGINIEYRENKVELSQA